MIERYVLGLERLKAILSADSFHKYSPVPGEIALISNIKPKTYTARMMDFDNEEARLIRLKRSKYPKKNGTIMTTVSLAKIPSPKARTRRINFSLSTKNKQRKRRPIAAGSTKPIVP
ncbi:MAG TPA: hypothetical protein P5214_09520 [Rectinema sp.]|jgi:hypothetical protein|nr:hypothetical protein [Thermotogaceae bacterium]HRU78617.1 hypothetical protein [Rectinema sp.]